MNSVLCTPSPVHANIHSILSIKPYRRMYTQCRPTTVSIHPIPDQCWVSVAALSCPHPDAGPKLFQHWVCCIRNSSTLANTCHLLNTVSTLAQRLRRWPSFETGLGDRHFPPPVARKNTTQITRYIGPMLMQCWATACDAGPPLFQSKPFKLLNMNVIVNILFLNTF